MHLGYFCYGMGKARLVLYRNKFISAIIEYSDIQRERQVSPLDSIPAIKNKSACILLSTIMYQDSFTLRAQDQNGEFIGACHGLFSGGVLRLTEQSGVFYKITPQKITEREILRVSPDRNCVGLASTEIALLTRKWSGTGMQPHQKKVEWWSDAGFENKICKSITGFSAKDRVVTDCHVALAAVLDGPFDGKAGWLVWGSDGGLATGGNGGESTAGIWYPSLECLPRKVSHECLYMPESVRQSLPEKVRSKEHVKVIPDVELGSADLAFTMEIRRLLEKAGEDAINP